MPVTLTRSLAWVCIVMIKRFEVKVTDLKFSFKVFKCPYNGYDLFYIVAMIIDQSLLHLF